ncbi:hypothetical protein [Azospirillum picis]|uniref:Ca2+/Na+ antiporter n=1 Tax=Azospirillum picis TaxID=488438 RepID=A0ABU0MUA4_9PROT|nr:hypothetical protein [Azospirillum picis]MBP2303147.1 Ca2+/Na+ antiporter [Azospirillum picis]MDQ0536899.1 Ca2+/Na+ antiporter [Azospirillum picis]
MSARAIVSLGIWILAMVLMGTMTVGMALAFYVLLTLCFAAVVAALTVLTRRRHEDPGEQSYL